MRELILPLKPQQTRKYPRVRAKFRVNCTVGNQTFPARASTLGGGGLFLDTDRPLAKGTEVHARFRPAKHLPQIEAKARVCYVLRGRGVALEFMGLTPDQLQILLRMIHRKPSDRRDFARAPLATQIQSQDCMALAFARNVGEGGMFIETKDPLPLGVKLNLRLPRALRSPHLGFSLENRRYGPWHDPVMKGGVTRGFSVKPPARGSGCRGE